MGNISPIYQQIDDSDKIEQSIINSIALRNCTEEIGHFKKNATTKNSISLRNCTEETIFFEKDTTTNNENECCPFQGYWLKQQTTLNNIDIRRKKTFFKEEDFFEDNGHYGKKLSNSLGNILPASFCQFPAQPSEFNHLDISAERKSLLKKATSIAKKHFSAIHDINVYNEVDPETDESWSVLEIDVSGEINNILDEFDNYTDAWIKEVAWPQRDDVRLFYNII